MNLQDVKDLVIVQAFRVEKNMIESDIADGSD